MGAGTAETGSGPPAAGHRPGAGDATPPPGRRRGHRWRRWALGAVALAVVALLAAAAAASWHFSSVLLVPDHQPGPYDLELIDAAPGRVVLPRNEDTERPGTYGLEWEGGHAILGPVIEVGDDSVTRRVRAVSGELGPGTETGIDFRVYEGNPRTALGIPFERVRVRGELGEMPAWVIPPAPRPAGAGGAAGRGGAHDTGAWAIFVHGLDGTREAVLRILPTLRRAGLTTLAITYRNDVGAPPSPDGKHHLGQTEWRDLEAAARFALARGARRLVLIGNSMGGAIVTQFIERSALAGRVAGLVLDAPALSWKPILAYGARERGLPSAFAIPVEWAVELRIDIDWERLDALRHTDELRLPTLLFHGTEDQLVPISLSEDLARALPREVGFHRVADAGHVESWNVDPRAYEAHLRAFVRRHATTAAASRSAPLVGDLEPDRVPAAGLRQRPVGHRLAAAR